MNRFVSVKKQLLYSMAFIAVILTGCKGGFGSGEPIFGGGGLSKLPPVVSAVTPLNLATGVPINGPIISATFNEPVGPINGGASFTVTCASPGINPTGTVALDAAGTTATFTASASLSPLTLYTATVTGAKSIATGLAMANPYTWTFTTGATPDTTRPRVTLTVPATSIPGPTLAVPTNTAITAAFTEDMAPATISATSFALTGPGGALVPGSVAYASRTAIYTPSAALAPATTYTVTITTAVTDLASNALAGNQAALPVASNYVWTFTTGLAPDLVRPRVTLTVPATVIPGPITGVAINTAIAAAFTEPMNPATITATSFTLTGPGLTVVPGAVSYASQTAIFTPTAVLLSATTYTATVTSAVTDVAGNQLAGNQAALPAASDYVWTFKTAAAPDTTRPRVTLTVPQTTIPGPTTGVATNTAISAAFTEPMNPLTINAASFLLTGPGVTPVTGSVSLLGQIAIFKPLANLAGNTTFTATITSAASDLAGNALAGNQAPLPAASNYVWTFTTGAAPDTISPTITLENPADLATGVAINNPINATFSEPMDLSNATFTLQLTGPPMGPILAGTTVYDPLTDTVTFTPPGNLLPSTEYTATILGATDLAGNPLVPGLKPNPWTFTTGSGLAPGAINLGSAATYGIMATAAVTSTGLTIINGDVSLDPGTSMTGFPPGVVNGTIHINDTESAQARADLLTAYNFGHTLPPGTTIGAGADLGALYPFGIPPGTYTSGSTMLVSTPLVLDAGGNANAVWVFQIGSSFTTTASVTLANGAQAKNVFWVPVSDGTIGVGTIFYGTIISGRNVTGVTGAVINGRILAGAITAGTIALDTNTVNVPAP